MAETEATAPLYLSPCKVAKSSRYAESNLHPTTLVHYDKHPKYGAGESG